MATEVDGDVPRSSESGTSASSSHQNWAVLLCASRYWFNYRHTSNVMLFYNQLRRLGYPDERIILMLADDVAANDRNVFPSRIYHQTPLKDNIYPKSIEVDYKGRAVNVATFKNVLVGDYEDFIPSSKRMNSDKNSNVLIFITGHGGDEFFKFQDFDEINSDEFASVFSKMHERGRYKQILLFFDTCQASTMIDKIRAPNIYAVSSSKLGESSYSDMPDKYVGLPLVDRFSQRFDLFLNLFMKNQQMTIQSMVEYFKEFDILSTVIYQATDAMSKQKMMGVKLADFLICSSYSPKKVASKLNSLPKEAILHKNILFSTSADKNNHKNFFGISVAVSFCLFILAYSIVLSKIRASSALKRK